MKNRFVHFGLVLLVIAAISAGILGLVNDFTKTVIAANNEKTQNAAKQEVLAAASKFDDEQAVESDGLKFIPGFDANGEKVGYVTTVATPGYGGDITFILGVKLDGTISGLRIVNQSETPGLGAKIGGIEWQDHWIGKDVSYEFTKSADAFAGATISPQAVYTGIIKALNAFKDGGDELMKTNYGKVLLSGIFKENPIFVLFLGLCPTLGVTSSAKNGLAMGLAVVAVLACSNLLISLFKKLIPSQVRIPAYIMIIASLVTIVQMVMEAYTPDLYKVLGLFIPLIVVNCIVLGRAESFASKNGVFASFLDGIGSGLGFTLSLTILGIVREALGNGTVFGVQVAPATYKPALIFILAPGAFITIAFMKAFLNYLQLKKSREG